MTELVRGLRDAVGDEHVLTDAGLRASYETDWTGRFAGSAVAVVRPADTDEVAAVVRLCAEAGAAVVAQGGNTGLVGGSVPRPALDRPQVVLSTTRLHDLSPVDPVTAQVTAGAGVALGDLQRHARAAGLLFGVDLAARDTATVGGLVATNAGGVHVLAHGAMRAHVVGLEAVLADGSVISRTGGLVKDNTGYDLSALLVGSEGTLGVVTAARLRLLRPPAATAVALVGVETTTAAVELLAAARAAVDVLAAELMYDDGIALVRAAADLPRPLAGTWPVYVLLEAACDEPALAEVLAGIAVVGDAALGPLWAYRERHTEAISSFGVPHKLDIGIAPARLPELESAVRALVKEVAPSARLVLFGHLGDGNLHVNVLGPAPDDATVDDAVLGLVVELGGTISAEHGIGIAKARWLPAVRSPAELGALAAIKHALDPADLFNPGVLLA